MVISVARYGHLNIADQLAVSRQSMDREWAGVPEFVGDVTIVERVKYWVKLAAKRLQNLGRSDHLPYMPLCVVGNVDQRAANAGGQLLAAHTAKGF
jgi:hypothetical protein